MNGTYRLKHSVLAVVVAVALAAPAPAVGFDMKKLSTVSKDYHTEKHVVGYYNAGDRMKVWGELGAF